MFEIVGAAARYVSHYMANVPEPVARVTSINFGTLANPDIRAFTFLRQRHGKLYYVEAPSAAHLIENRAHIPIYKIENNLATPSHKTADHPAIRSSYDALIADINALQGHVVHRDSAVFF